MIMHLTALLGFQLMGEALARAAGLPLPGPVIGMALLFVGLLTVPPLRRIAETARGLLSHLSLLFVPAGVGVVGHLDKLGSDGAALATAIVVSTALAILIGVFTFIGVARVMPK